MDPDEPVKSGHLILPSRKTTKKHQRTKYCVLYRASKLGIPRIEVYDNSDSVHSCQEKILPLQHCFKITNLSVTSFGVTTKHDIFHFEARDEGDKDAWIAALQAVIFPDDSPPPSANVELENELYCPSGDGYFYVKVLSTPAAVHCGIENKHYLLVLNPTSLELTHDGETLYSWPYQYIRKYGTTNKKFSFVAGRKCQSGEGQFLLDHANSEDIFRTVNMMMKSVKQKLSSSSEIHSPDHKLLEARSRSPLNPSMENLSSIDAKINQLIKRPPIKPPRKSPYNDDNNYEPIAPSETGGSSVSAYASVELPQAAWKTRGVDDVRHSESEEVYGSSWGVAPGKSQPASAVQPNAAGPKVIRQKQKSNSYDELDFFGSSTRLNAGAGYKQVLPIVPVPVVEAPCFNEYDEVDQLCFLQGVRLADDSHRGYASIRKEKAELKDVVHHQYHNNNEYAVIEKGKR